MIAFAAALRHAEGIAAPGASFPVFPRWDLEDAAARPQSTPRR